MAAVTLQQLLLHTYNIRQVQQDPGSVSWGVSTNLQAQDYTTIRPDQVLPWKDENSPLGGFGVNTVFASLLLKSFRNYNEIHQHLTEIVATEGDVCRFFSRGPGIFLELPFSGRVTCRSEVGPSGETHFSGTIDARINLSGSKATLHIIEFKKYGLLRQSSFLENNYPTPRERLGRKWRMYAHKYNCPQLTVFDGDLILCFIFKADDADDIANCEVTMIRGLANKPGYLLLLMQTMGISRLLGQLYHPLIIEGWTRHHRWYDGQPYWSAQGQDSRPAHPNLWTRTYHRDQGFHVWRRQGYQDKPERLRVPQAQTSFMF